MRSVQDLFSLKDRVAIVTGGRGLYGASISRALAEAGATVVIASRNGEKCEELARTMREEGFSAIGMSLDLASDESITAFVEGVIEKYGKIDVLVNNAVDRSNLASLRLASRKQLQDSMNVNLNGQIMLSQAVLVHMVNAHSGSIINISSMRGLDCPHFPFYPEAMREQSVNYTTEKWAMEGMTRYMAGYYGKDGIRVNSIAPGGYTPNIESTENGRAFSKNYIENCPLHCWANEDDIKGPVVFLASDASNYVTGATLVMDGGWTIW